MTSVLSNFRRVEDSLLASIILQLLPCQNHTRHNQTVSHSHYHSDYQSYCNKEEVCHRTTTSKQNPVLVFLDPPNKIKVLIKYIFHLAVGNDNNDRLRRMKRTLGSLYHNKQFQSDKRIRRIQKPAFRRNKHFQDTSFRRNIRSRKRLKGRRQQILIKGLKFNKTGGTVDLKEQGKSPRILTTAAERQSFLLDPTSDVRFTLLFILPPIMGILSMIGSSHTVPVGNNV